MAGKGPIGKPRRWRGWRLPKRNYRGLRFGSYLLDRALVEMANRGFINVEVHAKGSKDNPEAYSMFRRRAPRASRSLIIGHLVKT